MMKNPDFRRSRQAIEQFTQEYIKLRSNTTVINIPVVVHVVHADETQNISPAQIAGQMRILNEDFRRLNADASNTPALFGSVASDIQVTFCLARIDPNGNPTDGITRTLTTVQEFDIDTDQVKSDASEGKDPWPADEYLNIWVCKLAPGENGNILGYAQFPGGPMASDGVVIDYRYFGDFGTVSSPFDKGRTATHEVGHYLNLFHIWGDGDCSIDDEVEDTPLAGSANYTGEPCAFPGPNTCDTGTGDLPDMFMNYMDYSDDACMNMFSAGQKDRMRAVLALGGDRNSLVTSPAAGCGSYGDCIEGPLSVEITFDDFPEEIEWEIRNGDGIVASAGPYNQNLAGMTIVEAFPIDPGSYSFLVEDSFGDGICCDNGNGYIRLLDGNGQEVFFDNTFFEARSFSFCVSGTVECPSSLLLTDDPIASGDYTANDFIDASGRVASGDNVSLESGTVFLSPGFIAEAGATFSAIASADPCPVSMSSTTSPIIAETDSSRSAALPATTRRQVNDLSLFPNPSSGQVQVTWRIPQPGGYHLRAMTPLGQVVYEWESPKYFHPHDVHNVTIDLSRYAPGLYLVTLVGPDTQITRSVLIQ